MRIDNQSRARLQPGAQMKMTTMAHCPQCLPGLVLLVCCTLVAGCVQTPPPPARPVLAATAPVELLVAPNTQAEGELLDIGVVVFSSAISEAQGTEADAWLFAEISRKETQFLPYVLRNTLIASNQWGAVRVLPENDPSVDLHVYGTINQSDGEVLDLGIEVVDSTGREWLNKRYLEVAAMEDYPDTTRYTTGRRFDPNNFTDPFQDIYDQVANDMQLVRAEIDMNSVTEIKLVSELLYANDLAPESFAENLQVDAAGIRSVASLPANDDPMRQRVEAIRLRHYLFIDTVDDYYRALFDEMQPAYVLWRRFSLEQNQITAADQEELFEQDNYSDSNNYLALIQRYDRYKWSKIYEQEFTELASGFNNEIAPAILELNQQVHGLSGSLESQYRQWRGILREMFHLESGLPPASR